MNKVELLHDYFVERAFVIYKDAPKTAMKILDLAHHTKNFYEQPHFEFAFDDFLTWQNAVLEIREKNSNNDLNKTISLIVETAKRRMDNVVHAFFLNFPYGKNDETESLFRCIVEDFGEKHRE